MYKIESFVTFTADGHSSLVTLYVLALRILSSPVGRDKFREKFTTDINALSCSPDPKINVFSLSLSLSLSLSWLLK